MDIFLALELYKASFAGGMLPFDNARRAAIESGHSIAEAEMRGVYAVLDRFVGVVEGRVELTPAGAAVIVFRTERDA